MSPFQVFSDQVVCGVISSLSFAFRFYHARVSVYHRLRWTKMIPQGGTAQVISSLYNNCDPSSCWVSLVASLVLTVPQILLLLLVLHSHPPLLFPALLSTKRLIGGPVALFGRCDGVAVELRLFCQLVLSYDATFVLTGAFGICPGLLFSGGKDGVEDHP